MATDKSEKTESFFHMDSTSVSGYLQKKTRDGRWQRRWFETNGVYLTYYKTKKMEKLLAALSLPQVGEIKILPAEQDSDRLDGLFTIELNTRIYILRARNNEEARSWVSMLNKLREEGIKAANAPHSPMAAVEVDSHKNKNNNDNNSNKAKTDWNKSGKSCCGLC